LLKSGHGLFGLDPEWFWIGEGYMPVYLFST
jgi:hypothetical protein